VTAAGLTGLVARMAQRCTLLVRTEADDGEGGTVESWAGGRTFDAAVSTTGPTNALQLAGRPDAVAQCTMTCPRGTALHLHDRVRCADGRTLRVMSEAPARHTPGVASFAFERYECEEVADA
jgi:head-tail adaptor